ncbi:MAG TPA: DUF1549 domain-containing protein, partial [Planctomycetota bacterium]|nr:DUF1549 domain-containing protein [Planctomycetota bacterium]
MNLVLPLLVLLARPQDQADLSDTIDTLLPGIVGYRFSPEAGLVDDGEFLRRAMLDLWGVPPTFDDVVAFTKDVRPGKRSERVGTLLASPRFSNFWSRRIAEMFLGNFREAAGGTAFVRWLSDRLSEDRPWPDILRRMIEAEGSLSEVPELAWKVAWWREKDEGSAFTTALSRQVFGINLFCARCHDHAFDKWRTEDFHQLAAFTRGRMLRRTPSEILVEEAAFDPERHVYDPYERLGWGRFAKTSPRLFDAPAPTAGRKLSHSLADAIPQDAHTDRAFVNRVWAWLMGRGLVQPVDEFDLKNKPLSAPLLASLEADFRKHGRSLKALIQGICLSQGYRRRSDAPGEVRKITFSQGVVR